MEAPDAKEGYDGGGLEDARLVRGEDCSPQLHHSCEMQYSDAGSDEDTV